MNKLIFTALALVILAGAFPKESMTIIAWSSQTIGNLTDMVTPGQQTAIVIVAAVLTLVAMSK